jgi:dTDP-glucose pyrophosphorylase
MSDRIVVVEEQGEGTWLRRADFPEAKDARHWLKTVADPGTYHILSFRDEDVRVEAAPPTPTTNVVVVGKQHLERGPRVAKAAKPARSRKGANGASAIQGS